MTDQHLPGSEEGPPPADAFVPIGHSAEFAPQPRSKAVWVFTALIVVFLAAAGAFGVLWVNEKNDHKTTASQVETARAESEDSKARTAAAEARTKDADTKAETAKSEQAKIQAETAKDKKCADAGRAVFKVDENDPVALEGVGFQLGVNCS
jgi:cytoskeletal protein RodZ